MYTTIAVATGGALGSVARYGVTRWLASLIGQNLWGTFLVNVTGAFALGLLVGLTEERVSLDPVLRTGIAVGVLGGYTTFSTLMYESMREIEGRALWQSGLNLGGSVAIGLAAVALGLAAGRSAA
ncbi:MAG: CrcB family protein [Dehalococcoidia bacterium]|nr:CrcB family protein [Dehalococcoidia bacterium]HRC62184.1 CrcB family protein [Dehalococcoidia bacterium]